MIVEETDPTDSRCVRMIVIAIYTMISTVEMMASVKLTCHSTKKVPTVILISLSGKKEKLWLIADGDPLEKDIATLTLIASTMMNIVLTTSVSSI